MAQKPYVIFELRESQYAVAASDVREILRLPTLTPLAQSPPAIVGVVNLRGKVVPVLDLALRLGVGRRPYSIDDNVILLEREQGLLGLLVNRVHDVRAIAEEQIEDAPSYSDDARLRFLSGLAKVGEQIVMLLNIEAVARLSTTPDDLTAPENFGEVESERAFCPEATAEDRALFDARARSLRQPISSEDVTGLVPLAVVGLNDECFGVDLGLVREFCTIRHVTPVPCCPPHIVGMMNLRGDLLTLVDIRGVLKMPASDRVATGSVMIVETGDLHVGVPVDEVRDVTYLQPSQVTAVPSAVQGGGEVYLSGTAPYGKGMMSLLDLSAVLADPSFIVQEEV